jgi:hypothetical protein
MDLAMTGAWNGVSHGSDQSIHANLNAVRSVTHIDYLFSLSSIPYRRYLMFQLIFNPS